MMMSAEPENGFERRWYQAGALFLAIDTDKHNEKLHAASDAVLLDDNAILLHAVAVVTGGDHTWMPISPKPSEMLTHTLALKEDASVRMGVIWSSDYSEYSEVLDWVDIEAHEQLYSFSLEPFTLSSEEFASLSEDGSLLLLPSTFSDVVPGYLSTQSHSYKANVVKPEGRMDVNMADKLSDIHGSGSISTHVCTVSLDQKISIDERKTSQSVLAIPQPVLSVGQSVSARLSDEEGVEKTLKADLVHVGQGYGALVTSWT